MQVKSIDDLFKRTIEASSFAMEFDTSERISKLRENDKHRFADAMYLLAQNQRYEDLFENVFTSGNGSGKPIIQGGDKLITILSAIKDDKVRSLMALYAGEAISGYHENGAIKNIFGLDKPAIAYSKDELQDLQTRLECISMIPIFEREPSIHEGKGVHLALSLSGDALDAYKNLMSAFNGLSQGDLRFTSYKIIGSLSDTKYTSDDLASVINSVTDLTKIKDGLKSFDDTISKAIDTGKKERVDYVAKIAQKLSQVEKYAKWPATYFSGVSSLVQKFIGFKDDKIVKDLVSATMDLIDSGIKSSSTLYDIQSLAENNSRGFCGERTESLTEEQLGERTQRAIKSLVNLQSNELPYEVHVAYQAKGGKGIGLENFCDVATNPKVVDTFNYMSQRSVPEYAREAMANALVHGDQELAEQTAETFKQLVKIGAPKQVYKRLDTQHTSDKEKALEGMRAVGDGRVINVLRRYRGKSMGIVAGVFVNALYHNPEMVEGWVHTLDKHREQISQMSAQDRGEIKKYFGVDTSWRRKEYFSNDKLSWAQFQGKVNNWLNDCKKA